SQTCQNNDAPVQEGNGQCDAAESVVAGHRLGATRNQRGQDDQNDGTFGPLAKGGFCRIFERIVSGSAVFQPAQAVVEVAPNSALSFACGSSCGGVRHCYSLSVGEVCGETDCDSLAIVALSQLCVQFCCFCLRLFFQIGGKIGELLAELLSVVSGVSSQYFDGQESGVSCSVD